MPLIERVFCAFLSAILILSTSIIPAIGCGPFLPESIFVYHSHPDLPLRLFAEGQFGIIEPEYARSYLFVAYRYFSGKPLSAQEQAGVLALWHLRLCLDRDSGVDDAVKGWLQARKVTGLPAARDIYCYRTVDSNPDHSYMEYLNCQSAAFINAAQTLKQRIARYGAASQQVSEWIKGQDLVFCHCSSPRYDYSKNMSEPEPPFPPPPPASADALLRADRAYQLAAAHFYAQQFDLALKEFQAISADPRSPWKEIAPYLMARTLVRKATLADPMDMAALGKAEAAVKDILNNPRLQPLQEPARHLLSFISFRLYPGRRLAELSAAVQNPTNASSLTDNLFDYTQLMDNLSAQSEDDSSDSKNGLHYDELAPVLKEDDLTDWIFTFQCQDDKATEHALHKWEETGSLPWLMSALSKVPPGARQATKLLAAAQKLPPTSPAYLTVTYKSIKLLAAENQTSESAHLLSEVLLQKRRAIPPSTLNQLLDIKARQASSLAEFLRHVSRTPATISSNVDGLNLPDDVEKVEASKDFLKDRAGFEEETARVFNYQLPLSLLLQVAQSKDIAQSLRPDVVQAAWMRAMMLNKTALRDTLTPLLKGCIKELSPYLAAYSLAKSPDEQKFAAAYMILKFPGLRPYVTWGAGRLSQLNRIDDYQDNWWCAGGPDSESSIDNPDSAATKISPPAPSFLNAQDKVAAALENKQLTALGPAPNYLFQQVLPWAQSHRDDPRLPEALSLCVKATRFGSTNNQTSRLSKQAFQLLHKNYPKNPWAKKTRFWY